MAETVKVTRLPRARHGGKHAYFNRELSWLAFNRRVLEQAERPENPSMERLKFLSIVSSNLDEFFEIRVAGLIQQVESGIVEPGVDGLGPKEQLRRIHDVVGSLVEEQYRCFQEEIVPELREKNVSFLTIDQLTKQDLIWIKQYFREQVFPILTPLAVDPAHPFPQITNKSLNVLVSIDDPDNPEGEQHMAILPVPRILPRLVRIDRGDSSEFRFVFLSDVIKICADRLFPGYRVRSAHAFRITRNSDLYIDEEEAENFLEKIEAELKQRQKGAAVRLEIEAGIEEDLLQRLLIFIDLSGEYVFRINGPINLLRLMSVYDAIDRPDLKYPPFQGRIVSPLQNPDTLFQTIARKDILLHHPYDSFSPVVDFVRQAARDPEVLAIKQTLYRTSGDSPIVRALIDASRNGKQVTALVELKARFDEANNIQWAKQLEDEGVHVVYGMVGFKIHCKCSLIVRRENSVLRRYVHLGTGNYNPQTARLYTDLSLFTAHEEIASDVALLFNTLTGLGRTPNFKHLEVAPFNLHTNVQEAIARETENARQGKPAKIIARLNNLVDQTTIDNLYEASRAGVSIDLIARSTCCLVPGVPGLSENIHVRSIVGRFLEHSRIYYFLNHGGEPAVLAGSADWMPRNFYRRIETAFPIIDPRLQKRILEEILPHYLKDNRNATELLPSGAYRPVEKKPGEKPFSSQEYFLAEIEKENEAAAG